MAKENVASKTRETKVKARACWMKGYKAQVQGHLREAIRLYRRSLRLEPSAEAHTYLGWAYFYQGRLSLAIEECLQAIATDPSFGNPYNDIGAYFIEQGKWEESIPWLEKATEAERYEPRHFPHFNLARVFAHLGRRDEALEQAQKTLEILPDYVPALQLMSQLHSRFN